MKTYPNDQMVRYTHDGSFPPGRGPDRVCARTHMADPGDGSSNSARNWTRLGDAGDGLFCRQEDIYNLADFVKLLEEWQAVKNMVTANSPWAPG